MMVHPFVEIDNRRNPTVRHRAYGSVVMMRQFAHYSHKIPAGGMNYSGIQPFRAGGRKPRQTSVVRDHIISRGADLAVPSGFPVIFPDWEYRAPVWIIDSER
jgi:hypothetical protein